MDVTHFKLLIDTGRHVSVDMRTGDSVCHLICLSLRTNKTRELFETVFGTDVFVDWAKVSSLRKHANTSALWVDVLTTLCDITVPPKTDAAIATLSRPLHVLMCTLVKEGLTIDWPNVIRVFLLMNIDGLTSLYTLDMFLSKLLGRDVNKECMRVLASLADQRTSDEEFASTVNFTLRQCVRLKTEMMTR